MAAAAAANSSLKLVGGQVYLRILCSLLGLNNCEVMQARRAQLLLQLQQEQQQGGGQSQFQGGSISNLTSKSMYNFFQVFRFVTVEK